MGCHTEALSPSMPEKPEIAEASTADFEHGSGSIGRDVSRHKVVAS
jgi:hypothetical protein